MRSLKREKGSPASRAPRGYTPAQLTEYEDKIARKMIEKITVVDAEAIRISFKTAGSEIENKLV